MGQAKLRGSFADRVIQAIERNEREQARIDAERAARKSIQESAERAKRAAMTPDVRKSYDRRESMRRLNVAWMVGLAAHLITPDMVRKKPTGTVDEG